MKHFLVLITLTITGITNIYAQTQLRIKHYNIENGLAIQGFDPTAYFILNKAIPGNKNIAATVDGVTYLFATQKNKELFIKDSKKFEPQYGGWCAYAMGAVNERVEIDPETFKIVNGKLYLFYHSWINNTLTKWNDDEKNLKAMADKNWNVFYK